MGLHSGSTDQDHTDLEYIVSLLLRIGATKHSITLQHIYSHCGIPLSDKVDEMADAAAFATVDGLEDEQERIPVHFRDAKALIKEYAKTMLIQRTKKYKQINPKYQKTKLEDTWDREHQVFASQFRADQVRILGAWPRRFDKRMAESCRFCCPQDHEMEEKEEEIIPRGSKQPVTCAACKHIYANTGKYNNHFDTKVGKVCALTVKPIHLRGDAAAARTRPKEEIVRRPSTRGAPVETIDHVLGCPAVQAKWGKHDGTLKGIVDQIIKIKRTMEEEHLLKVKSEQDKKDRRLPSRLER